MCLIVKKKKQEAFYFEKQRNIQLYFKEEPGLSSCFFTIENLRKMLVFFNVTWEESL